MIKIKREGVVLEKTNLAFESGGVLNPAIYQDGDNLHLFYRAVKKGNFSTVGYAQLKGPTTVSYRSESPILSPEYSFESHGIEDPRIVKIGSLWYMTYTAFDGINALGALAISDDLKSWHKRGIITPKYDHRQFAEIAGMQKLNNKYVLSYQTMQQKQIPIYIWDKDLVMFPEKINEKYYFLHRIRPGIQIAHIEDLKDLNEIFWEKYLFQFSGHILMDPYYLHESAYIGAGCPPIETEDGWILIYHCVEDKPSGYVYTSSAALLDKKDPAKLISRLPYPLLRPDENWEKKGVVSNVVFPTGTALFDGRLFLYYGAADDCIAVASVDLKELVKELLHYKK